jgi:hypothetical protein
MPRSEKTSRLPDRTDLRAAFRTDVTGGTLAGGAVAGALFHARTAVLVHRQHAQPGGSNGRGREREHRLGRHPVQQSARRHRNDDRKPRDRVGYPDHALERLFTAAKQERVVQQRVQRARDRRLGRSPQHEPEREPEKSRHREPQDKACSLDRRGEQHHELPAPQIGYDTGWNLEQKRGRGPDSHQDRDLGETQAVLAEHDRVDRVYEPQILKEHEKKVGNFVLVQFHAHLLEACGSNRTHCSKEGLGCINVSSAWTECSMTPAIYQVSRI